jgi:hypothetical protein
MKYLYLDFEFNQVSEPVLNLVCATTELSDGETLDWWLHKDKEAKIKLRDYLISKVKEGYIFSGYACEAEARCVFDLGINSLKIFWYDLFIEYRMLSNHNTSINSGMQLVSGKVKRVFPGEKGAELGLLAACYKLLGVNLNKEHKDKMRDLIISSPEEFSDEDRVSIMEYCRLDVKYLKKLHFEINRRFGRLLERRDRESYLVNALNRGRYAALTAKMVRLGYPINLEWAKNFTDNIPALLNSCIEDINSQFEDIKPFKFNRLTGKYGMSTKALKEWIAKKGFKDWERTETDQLSLSLPAWTKYFNFTHDYPRNNLGAQIVRYLKLKQAVNGFTEKAGEAKKTFWDYVGSDGRVRPYMGIFKAQSSRSQPASTGFIFLKPAWQRSLVQPLPGKAICGCDWSSEEYLLSALEYKDMKMIRNYESGDVYLAFAKDIRLVPRDATKQSHKYERDLCKSTILGLSYLMSKYGLSLKLSAETGKDISEDLAQEYIDKFDSTYLAFSEGRQRVIEDYVRKVVDYLVLKDGWVMFGDNPNFRSAGNFPIQGIAAAIMRKAVDLCYEKGLNVIFTLHDAIYIEYDSQDFSAIDKLRDCMREAFIFYYKGTSMEEYAKLIRMDAEAWSPDYASRVGEILFKSRDFHCRLEEIHIDERAVSEFNRFNHFFKSSLGMDLL